MSEVHEALRFAKAAETQMPIDQEARSLFVVCGRSLLIAVSIGCALLLVVLAADWRHGFSMSGALAQFLVLAVLGAGSAYLAVRGRNSTVSRAVFEIAALAVVLVAVEVATVAWTPNPKDAKALRQRAADRLGLPFDSRDVSEVVRDLRSTGVDALPGLGFDWARLPGVREHLPAGLFPLSHASNAVVVACNESGRYFTYRTDESGFNNPPGLLAAGGIDVALVGESYVLGFCLPAAQSFPARIRERYPRTANFALAGNRTLGQLGSFREFVEPIRPRIVLWAINPNFVFDRDDVRDPVLVRYLEPGFSQNLRTQQPEINRLVRQLAIPVQAELDDRAQAMQRDIRLLRYQQAWRLPETRSLLGRALGTDPQGAGGPDLADFIHTLRLVKRTTEQWNGKLIVVLLPIYSEVVADQVQGNLRHDRLATVVSGLGIPVVDGVDLFEKSPDPAAHFTLRINNHPTAEAYALLAGRVLEEIDAQFPGLTIAGR